MDLDVYLLKFVFVPISIFFFLALAMYPGFGCLFNISYQGSHLIVYVYFLWRKTLYTSLWIQSGANEFGQLGDGTEDSRKYPKKVKQLETEFVKSVSCGAHCTAAIAEPRQNDGTILSRLWVWGQNQVVILFQLTLLSYKHQ